MYICIRYIMIHSDRYVLTVYLCPVYIYIYIYIFSPTLKGFVLGCLKFDIIDTVTHRTFFVVEGFLICYWKPIAASFLPIMASKNVSIYCQVSPDRQQCLISKSVTYA